MGPHIGESFGIDLDAPREIAILLGLLKAKSKRKTLAGLGRGLRYLNEPAWQHTTANSGKGFSK